MTILNVDDDPQARRALKISLVSRGFEVDEAASGEEAVEKIRAGLPDVVLLDVQLPGMSGIETCRAIRTTSRVPVIVISVKKLSSERAEAFEAGVDQYLTKPFDIEELIVRIRALVRRTRSLYTRVIHLDGVEIDLDSHEVKRADATVHLTAKEFKLLRCLAEHAGEVVSHRRLLQSVWGPDYGNEVEYLRVFINQVRKKIEPDPRHPRYLVTEPAMGYRLAIRNAASSNP
ncbi:MAG TPA: response regulator transcription factor [Candidatus Acidoferrales bacterium]|nr:response regulator transcription factor [Candidatus Acidoferrales bacterium]